MTFFIILSFIMIAIGVIVFIESTKSKSKLIAVALIAIALAILIPLCFVGGDPNYSSSSGSKWSDLSDVEKENARWAYYAKQAADKYGK